MPRRKADAQENIEKKQDAKTQPKEEKQQGIEENFAQLEEIIRKLEAGDSTLEESFTCYEAGMKLVKTCGGKIDKVEKQILVLNGNNTEDVR